MIVRGATEQDRNLTLSEANESSVAFIVLLQCIAFNSLVRSILEYCAPLFIGMSKNNANKLEKKIVPLS